MWYIHDQGVYICAQGGYVHVQGGYVITYMLREGM